MKSDTVNEPKTGWVRVVLALVVACDAIAVFFGLKDLMQAATLAVSRTAVPHADACGPPWPADDLLPVLYQDLHRQRRAGDLHAQRLIR
jgi:hypothetical protein